MLRLTPIKKLLSPKRIKERKNQLREDRMNVEWPTMINGILMYTRQIEEAKQQVAQTFKQIHTTHNETNRRLEGGKITEKNNTQTESANAELQIKIEREDNPINEIE